MGGFQHIDLLANGFQFSVLDTERIAQILRTII